MKKINKKEYFLLLIFFGLLMFTAAQSQTLNITLTWSANTYVPPGYQGRALPARGSAVEIAATVESSGTKPELLSYQWIVNGLVQETGSGIGKQAFNLKIPDETARDYLVKVEVGDKNGNFLGVSSYMTIPIVNPEIVLTADASPVSAESYLVLPEQETDFIAQPYFFNINRITDLSFKWNLGEQEAFLIDSITPNVLSLKVNQRTETASQTLFVSAENKSNPFQTAQTKAEIIFIPNQ
jgi:hypothetical protein